MEGVMVHSSTKTEVFFIFTDFLNYVYGPWKGKMPVRDSTS
jgi:hypothetical protein